jgi:hypothetical protein
MAERLRPMLTLMLVPTVLGILWFYARVKAHPMERRAAEADAAFFTMVPADTEPLIRRADPDRDEPRQADLDDLFADDLAFAEMLAQTPAQPVDELP